MLTHCWYKDRTSRWNNKREDKQCDSDIANYAWSTNAIFLCSVHSCRMTKTAPQPRKIQVHKSNRQTGAENKQDLFQIIFKEIAVVFKIAGNNFPNVNKISPNK
jgi:hypothetical protein